MEGGRIIVTENLYFNVQTRPLITSANDTCNNTNFEEPGASKQIGAIHNKNLFWTHEHNSFPYRTTVTWRDYTNANYNILNFHVKLCAYTTGPMYFILNLLKKTFKFMIRYTKIIESTYSKNLSNPSLMNISINLDNYLLMIL